MKIKTIEVAGLHSALHAMRNPMDSWEKSDSHTGYVGEKDRDLSTRLTNAGPEHAKHLRMVMVWAEIWAPRFWWNEFDTYRIGVEKLSCSTMHTLMKRYLTPEDFEHTIGQDGEAYIRPELMDTISRINDMMDDWKAEEDSDRKKEIWFNVIALLPQSFIQRRTVMMSYAALRNICKQREGHKLPEWAQFRKWAKGLPESWMIMEANDK